MTGSLTWWIVQFSITFLDFVMLYLLAHAILKRKITFNITHVIYLILYTAIVAPMYLVDTYFFRVVGILLLLLILKLVSKRGFGDVAIIYCLSFFIIATIQVPLVTVVWLFYELLDFQRPFVFLIVQLLTTVAVVFACRKLKLNQWFHALQINTVMRLILFLLALLILLVVFILNFEYQLTYLLFFATAIVFVVAVLYPIFIKLYHNFIGIISVHDLKNSLLSVAITISDMDDPKEIKKIFGKFSKDFGMDVSQLDFDVESDIDRLKANNKKVETFIQNKLGNCKKEIKVASDLMYYEAHNDVDFPVTLKWLGTLLDNALEASVNNPIYIKLYSISDDFSLQIGNEFVGEKDKDIKDIFICGYSTKEAGRGIGLHSLYREVTELDGEVKVDEYYSDEHNCNYIRINILFEYNPLKALEKFKKDTMD